MPLTSYAQQGRQNGSSGMEAIPLPEAAAATFKANEICGLSASGQVKQLPAGAVTSTTAECANGIVRPAQDASGVTNATVSCEVLDNFSRGWIPISNAGAVVTSNANMIGDSYAGYVAPAGAAFIDAQLTVDTNAAGNPLFKILGFDTREAVGTTSNIHYAYVEFIPAARLAG